jgi:hypothetical protein
VRPRRNLQVAAILVLLAVASALFVVVLWIPLYGERQNHRFADEQEEPALQAEIVREDATGVRSWSLKDQQALRKLRDGLRNADYAGAKEPKADQSFRLRIRRSDSRVDEYEVQLDERGSEHDMLYVVRRSGGSPIYGSAYKTPELRAALQQLMKEPQPPSK